MTTTTTTGQRNRTHRGAPLLPIGPFRAWLQIRLRHGGWTITDLADAVGHHERRVRTFLTQGEYVGELTVEHYGIALTGDPRLAARLYPELDW